MKKKINRILNQFNKNITEKKTHTLESPLAGGAAGFPSHNFTFPITAVNSGWCERVLNQRLTLLYGFLVSGSKTF